MENRHNRAVWHLRLKDIVLTTINAKWIHPSLALRLLKANLGVLEDRCEIIELNLRQPLAEKLALLTNARPRILGISVSIWNHTATLELLDELEKVWKEQGEKPVVVLGGPEVSHLPPDAKIFRHADCVIRGEGEIVLRELCEKILSENKTKTSRLCVAYHRYDASLREESQDNPQFITAENVNVNEIKSAYHLYTDEDIAKKLIYVEASRGCVFNCDFCLSAVDKSPVRAPKVRDFPLEPFFAEMDILIQRGVKTFKFLDRSFNVNIERAVQIMEFFLLKIEERKGQGFVVHFEMVSSLFPPELREALKRFPPGTLRLEIGIQTLNSEAAACINRPSYPEKELEALRFLREKTNAIMHVDLIAGLPGEDLVSFGNGFDRLWLALSDSVSAEEAEQHTEIQLGILKLLPGAPISRHNEAYGMRYNPMPPYEIEETSVMSADDLLRVKNFARFWEITVNRGLIKLPAKEPVFSKFMELSDSLYAKFERNWGIDREELLEYVKSII